MSLTKCVECGSTNLSNVFHIIEHQENGKTLVIENIPAIQCNSCKEIFLSPRASKYIDKQIAIFRTS
ncbi:YgiT-type zinc finger protein [Paenibacillus dokdonensis]|uniref:YgiT-type zinc finger protein n=1 Tax=Paenibacillus dokdonensis TaxID=2567944 RepID=UPI0010A78B95